MPDRDGVAVRGNSRSEAFHRIHSRERNGSGALKLLISAAEASSDTHGAALLQALKKECRLEGIELETFGIGGARLASEGHRILIPAKNLLSMGFVEVLGRLKKILGYVDEMDQAAARERPDAAILLDYPDFHFKLAERLKARGIPTICMIPPKVWVWRRGRLRKIRDLYRHVFSILPFEKPLYEKAQIPFTYMGNPLLDELPIGVSKRDARQKLGITEAERVLLLMPGSRPSELKYHLAPMLEAAVQIQATLGEKLRVLMPLAEISDLERTRLEISRIPASASLDLKLTQGDAWLAMIAADAGIIKSGTSTLEAAVLDCPHVVVYRAHPISEWIVKNVIRYDRPISLVNLVEGWDYGKAYIVDELILERFKPSLMVEKALPLFHATSSERTKMLERFVGVRNSLRPEGGLGTSPSRKAAQEIVKLVRKWRVK